MGGGIGETYPLQRLRRRRPRLLRGSQWTSNGTKAVCAGRAVNRANSAAALLRWACAELAALDDPRAEAEWLLAATLGCRRATLHARLQECPDETALQRLRERVERRGRGEPLAYVLGSAEFWNLDLACDARALVPRPETELLVEWGLECLRGRTAPRVADLGTGSGAIALALARDCPQAFVLGVERDAAALQLAAENRRRYRATNLTLSRGDWLDALRASSFELIVANPPYVAPGDPRLAPEVARFEPHAALFAGADGLAALRAIVVAAPHGLAPAGWLLCEHAPDQASAVRGLMIEAGLSEVSTRPDLAGHPRATGGRSALLREHASPARRATGRGWHHGNGP
ncbi:MAG: peptide chain release factor N(5)-glutamine methyltransferase [Gammaproteobacteria bacterium]|nr:peptide chain release factor N(5)-glutamine methyltransferase [Gammaproteobacteria bacterium]